MAHSVDMEKFYWSQCGNTAADKQAEYLLCLQSDSSSNLEVQCSSILKICAICGESFIHSCIGAFTVQCNVSMFVFYYHLQLTHDPV